MEERRVKSFSDFICTACRVVAIGEKMIDFSEQFQLFMVTRNPSMDIAPDARPLVAQVKRIDPKPPPAKKDPGGNE